jgi:hypothetical protein
LHRAEAAPVATYAVLLAACAALLTACAGNVVNLGEDGESARPTLPAYSLCLESPTLAVTGTAVIGTWTVDQQEQLDELEGCETIAGSLLIRPTFQPDLRPLHTLKVVVGGLSFEQTYQYDVEKEAEQEASLQLIADGWVPSLAGLEGLERVGSLALSGVAATDLTPLSGLRELTRGELVLRDVMTRDLAPLAGLEGILSLEVSGAQLESIADLQLPPVMSSLQLSAPLLTNADALQNVQSLLESAQVYGTALTDLRALSGLGHVGGDFNISGNSALRSLDGLQALSDVGGLLAISGNDALESIDALRRLDAADSLEISFNSVLARLPDLFISRLSSLSIEDNPSLREIVGFPGLLNSGSPVRANPLTRAVTTPESLLAQRALRFQVTDNPLLEHLAIPGGWQSIQQAVVRDNASLRDLDIGTLEAIDLLTIANNAQLTSVDLGELTSVDLLSVVDNPQLPATNFDPVMTFAREMSGNAGQ